MECFSAGPCRDVPAENERNTFFRSERKGSVMRTVLVSIFLFLAFIFCPVHAEGKDLPTLVSLSGACLLITSLDVSRG